MKNRFKLAFSITETIIILTVLAVAIAASTPLITKKVVNVADAGATVTGAAHGRYEIFTKEIITTPDGDYEKTSTPPESGSGLFGGGADSDIVVFRRLSDEEYIQILNEVPNLSTATATIGKYKDTLYEQIDDVKATRNAEGEIDFVEYKKNGEIIKSPVGGSIIVENANLTYKKGCLGWTDTNKEVRIFVEAGKSVEYYDNSGAKHTKCNIATAKLPTANNRLIEGVYTKRISQTLDGNTLWHAEVDNPQYNFDCDDTSIPWERIYSSNTLIIDRPVVPQDTDGDGEKDFVGTFDPGKKALNLVIHAVGGGGAGGGIKDAGNAISPKGKSQFSSEMKALKEELYARFHALTGTSIPIDKLVRFKNEPLYNKKNIFYDDDNYIVINTFDGTISVKVDVRSGKGYQVFPHQLLQYTKKLGSQSQASELYHMPIWGNFNSIWDRGFRAGVAGEGANGGHGPIYTVDTSSKHLVSKEAQYAGFKGKDDALICCTEHAPSPCCCSWRAVYSCSGTGKKQVCGWGRECAGPWTQCCCGMKIWKRTCYYNCSGPNYSNCGNTLTFLAHYSMGEKPRTCPTQNGIFETADCKHTISGGAGGAAGKIAVACTRVGAPTYVDIFCDKPGVGSQGTARNVTYGETQTVSSGTKGRTCTMFAGTATATSTGGEGGKPCTQTAYSMDVDDKGALEGMTDQNIIKAGDNWTPSNLDTIIPASEGGNGKATYRQAALAYNYVAKTPPNPTVAANKNGTKYVGEEDGAKLSYSIDIINESSGGLVFALSEIRQYTKNKADEGLLTQGATKLACGSTTNCGASGAPGDSWGVCGDFTGIDFTHGAYSNHIYSWTIPYAFNQLTYGDAGEAGEYKTTKIGKVDEPINIKLGRGGVWEKPNNSVTPAWEKGIKGPSGTDTIVSVGNKKVLVAKGGEGGNKSGKSRKYDLCYPINPSDYKKIDTVHGIEVGLCQPTGPNQTAIGCCNKERGTRSTRDIAASAINLSAIENIKSLVGNSLVIGIGAGRGGEGVGTRAGVEDVGGIRTFTNISGKDIEFPTSSVFQPPTSQYIYNGFEVNSTEYNNTIVKPSEHNFRGGDGAVIITW